MSDSSQQKAHAVTGAFGFLGKYTATRLLDAGRRVVTLTGSPERSNPFEGKIEARRFHFDDVEAMAASLRDVEVLYNTYWVRLGYGGTTHADAVRNTGVLFEAAKRAGVSRIVHVSVANADEHSSLAYYKGKGQVERALQASGLGYSIVRPALLFGKNSVLINNIAWTLRHLPVFAFFGSGEYRVRPVYVDDAAAILVEQGRLRENTEVYAFGPEEFTYRELVKMLGEAIGCRRPMIRIPVWMGSISSWFIGKLMQDIFVTREEIEALMSGLLYVPGAASTGNTRLSDWAREHADTIGKHYANEVQRHIDRRKAY